VVNKVFCKMLQMVCRLHFILVNLSLLDECCTVNVRVKSLDINGTTNGEGSYRRHN
jgi:hypothetical protein